MSTTSTSQGVSFNPATNVVTLEHERYTIARDADFQDFLEEAPVERLTAMRNALKSIARSFGVVRSPTADLVRQRLHDLRQHMHHASR